MSVGEGSFGRVVRMFHPTLPDFARKIGFIDQSRHTNEHGFAKEYLVLKKARNENQAHIIRLHPLRPGQKDEVSRNELMREIYFDTEYAGLGNLREWIQNSPRMIINEALVCWVGNQLASGLLWMHRNQYLHGDIKPDNILVVSFHGDPIIKIGDVGSVVTMSRTGKAFPNTIFGCITTPLYAAPEMLLAGIDGKLVKNKAPAYKDYYDLVKPDITLAADIYSFGVTLTDIAGTQHPEYPVSKLPGPNAVANMCFVHTKRPHDLAVFNSRFEPSPQFSQLLSDLTRFYPQNRPTIEDVFRRPVLNRGNFQITKWAKPEKLQALTKEKLETLTEEIKTLKRRLADRESDLMTAQRSLILTRLAANPKATINSEVQTTPLHSPTSIADPSQSSTLPFQPSPHSTLPPLIIVTQTPVQSPLPTLASPIDSPIRSPSPFPTAKPKSPSPIPNAIVTPILSEEVIRLTKIFNLTFFFPIEIEVNFYPCSCRIVGL